MNVFMISSEAYPFSKTGGLGDIVGNLPHALKQVNVNSSLIIPLYKDNYKLINNNTYAAFDIKLGSETIKTEIIKHKHNNIDVYFVKNDFLFKRDGIYSENSKDYEDNAKRFIAFTKTAIELLIYLHKKENIKLDIVHLHDWQSALAAIYIKEIYNTEECFKNTKVIFTIHNLAYQGNFNTDIYSLLNISWKYFIPSRIEFYGYVSFIKAGIILSDVVTTVSPNYAKEIQTEEFGCGLNNLLLNKNEQGKLFGILNGMHDTQWNPTTDKYIKYNYDINTKEKKKLIRNALYKELKIKEKNYPLVTMISRFDPQKGLDLIYSSFFELSTYDANFIFLFSSNNYFKDFENDFMSRVKRAKNIRVLFLFDEALAHKLTAASDIYLMPSRFEPCGLNQIYSMKYGSLPIVHSVGGLKDTVVNYNGAKTMKKATGFSFNEYSQKSFVEAMDLAFDLYYNNKNHFDNLVDNAMKKDYSLLKTALEYKKLYNKVLKNK